MFAKANPENMVEDRYSCVLRLPVIPFGLLGLDLKMIGTLSDRRLGCSSIRLWDTLSCFRLGFRVLVMEDA
jgi:hypothetical protein